MPVKEAVVHCQHVSRTVGRDATFSSCGTPNVDKLLTQWLRINIRYLLGSFLFNSHLMSRLLEIEPPSLAFSFPLPSNRIKKFQPSKFSVPAFGITRLITSLALYKKCVKSPTRVGTIEDLNYRPK